MSVISGMTLVALPEVKQAWVASVIPIASALFIISELLRLPAVMEEARRGPILDHEIKEALETIESTDENVARRERAP
jgi:TRAP-type C4-dicarboxylate transport system permease small subunit